VDDWIDSYKVNRDAAVLSLMQFFISASGCKGKITSSMQASKEHATIIQRMTEEFLKVTCHCSAANIQRNGA
jgi:cohesin complex subunit SA-1/2